MARLTITIAQTGETFFCSSAMSVLQGMASLGRKGIPAGCHCGGCGVCKIEILAGEYQCGLMSRAHVSEDEQNRAVVLACRIRPQSDLLVRVVGKMCKSVCR
ncbi:ferredoxin [Glaciimonas sp. PCH181]|nr:ferredoxin [Glaciimonas sp. PCH181]